jgi:hypothetical protein
MGAVIVIVIGMEGGKDSDSRCKIKEVLSVNLIKIIGVFGRCETLCNIFLGFIIIQI